MMKVDDIEESLFYVGGCGLVHKRNCAKERRKRRAAGLVAFLVKAM